MMSRSVTNCHIGTALRQARMGALSMMRSRARMSPVCKACCTLSTSCAGLLPHGSVCTGERDWECEAFRDDQRGSHKREPEQASHASVRRRAATRREPGREVESVSSL